MAAPVFDPISDQRLSDLRKRLGDTGWMELLEKAREQESIILALRTKTEAGSSLTRAVSEEGLDVSVPTIRRWIKRYEEKGLAGLMTRPGRTPEGHPDPIPSPSKRRTRKPRSFIKWAGSKASVLDEILAGFPRKFGCYYEPMAGSATVFFALKPKRAVLCDSNEELMNSFRVLRDHPEPLIALLEEQPNTSRHFYETRALEPSTLSPLRRAVRFIYLNKTCFNGMYRVNSKGRFNVPYGRIAHARICDEYTLRWTSEALRGTRLHTGDYRDAVADAGPGDLVYFDPPYLRPEASNPGSRLYQPDEFDHGAQGELARIFRELVERGCHVTASNSDHPLVRELYDGFEIKVLDVRRPINRNAKGRAGHKEVLIMGSRERPAERQLRLL